MAAGYKFCELHIYDICQQSKYVCCSLFIPPKNTEILILVYLHYLNTVLGATF